MSWNEVLNDFILQAQQNNLKTSTYPKEWDSLRLRISFGMGAPARIPWVAFVAPDMEVSKGFYPVYLYYKDSNTLILSYGISETEEFGKSWPSEIMSSAQTITAYFDKKVARYGDSFVFKAYKVNVKGNKVELAYPESKKVASSQDIESDLDTLLDYYKNAVNLSSSRISPELSQGLFYMEKQLEDFLIANWPHTELGKKLDLIIEEGELLSQQYKTDLGPIDILAKDKKTGSYVVIELKKNQTSDDTIGQLARYMGWIRLNKKDDKVRGIIIAGQYDKKLDYALKMVPNTEVFIYEVDFKLNSFERVS